MVRQRGDAEGDVGCSQAKDREVVSVFRYGTFPRACTVCGERKPQPHWSRLATCGRVCGAARQRDTKAANRPDHLRLKFGRMSRRERVIYVTAYQAGYARAKWRAGQQRKDAA